MARRKPNPEDIRNKERYFNRYVALEVKNDRRKQKEIRENEFSLDEWMEFDCKFEVKLAVNSSDEFYAHICTENDHFAWIEEIETLELYEAVQCLEHEEKLLISYAWNEGYSQREIAGFLGISQPAVLKRLNAISKKIKKYLKTGYQNW